MEWIIIGIVMAIIITAGMVAVLRKERYKREIPILLKEAPRTRQQILFCVYGKTKGDYVPLGNALLELEEEKVIHKSDGIWYLTEE